MIECKPTSWFSWTYLVEGRGHSALLSFASILNEHGVIELDGKALQCRHLGRTSGKWALMDGETEGAIASKPSFTSRAFEITSQGKTYALKPKSMWTRGFQLMDGETVVAVITPTNFVSRAPTITEAPARFPFDVLAFAFWLTALIWRRNSHSD